MAQVHYIVAMKLHFSYLCVAILIYTKSTHNLLNLNVDLHTAHYVGFHNLVLWARDWLGF